MRGLRAARLQTRAFAWAACSLLSCVLAQTPGASPRSPLFPGFSTEAPPRDASGEGDFGALGAFDTARSRVRIPATDGTAPPLAGVPDLAGETGEVLCTHPVVGETRKRNANALFPLVLYLHPTHGLVFEGWIAQNDAMLRVLASRGFVVCAPTIVGARDGRGPDSPVVGGLFPGEQHTAAVIERRVYPRLLAFAPRAAAHLVRMSLTGSPSDLSYDSGHSTRPSSNRSSALSFPESLARVIDPSRIAFAGFSSGAALAIYAADAAEQTWPGATRAVVALAPTIGDFDFARTQFEGRAKRTRVPMLLVAGAEDGMGGLEGLVELGDAATRAPRVGVAVAGASHCHLYIPVGSECDWYDAFNDQGGIGKLGRFAASAFLHAYMGFPHAAAANDKDAAAFFSAEQKKAIDVAWGGSEALNFVGAGAWNARVLVEPLVELGLLEPEGKTKRTTASKTNRHTASYAYDPLNDAWTATVPLRVAAKEKRCLTEARVMEVSGTSLRAFLDAGRVKTNATAYPTYPAQPVGASVLVFPSLPERDDQKRVDLILEWRADESAKRDKRGVAAPELAPDVTRRNRRLLGGERPRLPFRREAEDVREASRVGKTSPPHPHISADVFVDGVKDVFFSPAETTVQTFGLSPGPDTDYRYEQTAFGASPNELSELDSTPDREIVRTEKVRVRALDACDGGTAAFLTLEVAPPRMSPARNDASRYSESDDYAVGAFGARRETAPLDDAPEATSATSWEDALFRETAFSARPSRWDPLSG
jgi:dienelactone hydrolase